MIYLDRDLQRQVCATFHYALRTNGYLFVDSSESIERQSLFRTINRDARIFQAMERPRELPPLPRVITGPRITQIPALQEAIANQKPAMVSSTGKLLRYLHHPACWSTKDSVSACVRHGWTVPAPAGRSAFNGSG